MSGISWLHELSILHSLEVKIRTCIQNIVLWNQPICVPKTKFFIKHFTPTKTKWFFKIHTCIGIIPEIHCTNKNKKEHACVFLRKPGNLQPIQLIQHLHMNLDSESFKIPSYTDLIKNWYLLFSFIKIQKKNKKINKWILQTS